MGLHIIMRLVREKEAPLGFPEMTSMIIYFSITTAAAFGFR